MIAKQRQQSDLARWKWNRLENAPNSFAVKILTSKLFAIKLLQTLFAKPAPRRILQVGRGGGYPV